MTSPTQAVTTAKGRWYPRNGLDYMSVTTAISALPKDALVQWAANMAADKAMFLLADGITLACLGRTPEQVRDEIRYAHKQRKEGAADVGTEVHRMVEVFLLGGDPHTDDKEAAKRFKHFLKWHDTFAIEPMYVEATVYNDTHLYAGSCDLMAMVDGIPTIIDLKTSKGVYGTVALQLAAYRFADYILTDEGKQLDIPRFDRGAVLHIRPTGYTFREVDVSEEMFAHFIRLLETKREWINRAEKTALLPAIEPTNKEKAWISRFPK